MSSFTVTIVLPHTENETVFLMHVVQAALKAYRNNPHRIDHLNGNGVVHATDDAEPTIETLDLPAHTTA
jgi:hypothetical protein